MIKEILGVFPRKWLHRLIFLFLLKYIGLLGILGPLETRFDAEPVDPGVLDRIYTPLSLVSL